MPLAIFGGGRIRTNTPAENAYNALQAANQQIALRQLRLSTGKRINSPADDVAGYITSRSLLARVGSLRSALTAVGDAKNVTAIAMDGLDNISSLLTKIKEAASTAASGALGTDEKVSLAQAAYRLAEQIQTVVNSTVFGGEELLANTFSGDFVIGFRANNTLITIGIDLTTANSFAVNLNVENNTAFAGVQGLDLTSLNAVSTSDLGIFSATQISTTLASLASALDNITNFAAYIGGITNRLESQEAALQTQITNYNAAISRIEDADVALEQLELIKAQFLQQSSVISLAQANQFPQVFLQLLV